MAYYNLEADNYGCGKRCCSQHQDLTFERYVKRYRTTPDVIKLIPKWMMHHKVRRLNFKNHPTMKPIIEIIVEHHSDTEYEEDSDEAMLNNIRENDIVDIDNCIHCMEVDVKIAFEE